MRTPEMLREKERHQRRAIADAIAVLHEDADFEGVDRAHVHLGPLRLPTGDIVSPLNSRFCR